MQKKILSIYLVIAICFLSIFYCVIPVYAASPVPNWQAIYTVDSSQDAKIIGDFKNTEAMQLYHSLSESEKRLVDLQYYASMVDTYGDTNFEPANNIKSQIKDTMVSILGVAGITYAGFKDLADYLGIHKKIAETSQKSGGLKKSLGLSDTAVVNGKINVSKDFINNLRSNVAKFENYVIYPPAPSELNYYLNFVGIKNFNSSSAVETYNTSIVPYHYWVAYGNTTNSGYNLVYFVATPKGCLYYKDDFGRLVGLIGTSTMNKYSKSGYKLYKNNDDGSSYSFSYFSDYAYCKDLVGRIGIYQKVFNSYNDLYNYVNYLNGNKVSNYYISTEIVNNDYSTTVNKIYDYSSHDTYTTINNNITQAITDKGSGLTDEEYQKIVDEVMKKVQQEIDSKDDGGNTGGGSGGDSGNTGGGSGGDSGNTGGGESNTWLEKIYNRLGDILEKIGTVTGVDTLVSLVQQIADDVHKLKNGEAIAPDMSVTNGLLSDIAASLKTLIGVSAAGDISDLLADTVGDKISDYIGNVKNAATEMTDALQEVFPFSIPWDLMAIFGLFSAESKAPVFDIPIVVPSLGINETFHIDFSDFEYISVICRTMLGISFAVGLMWITIELTKEGD